MFFSMLIVDTVSIVISENEGILCYVHCDLHSIVVDFLRAVQLYFRVRLHEVTAANLWLWLIKKRTSSLKLYFIITKEKGV